MSEFERTTPSVSRRSEVGSPLAPDHIPPLARFVFGGLSFGHSPYHLLVLHLSKPSGSLIEAPESIHEEAALPPPPNRVRMSRMR